MWEYLKQHESWIRKRLAEEHDPKACRVIRAIHEEMIARMQHERMIHLIVTLFVALFTLLAVGFAVLTHWMFAFALSVVLIGLTSAYLVHYFRLENGVQRWYRLSDELRARIETPAPSRRE